MLRKQRVSVSDKQYYLVSSVRWWPVVLQKTPQYELSPLFPCDNQHVYLIKSILALPVICMILQMYVVCKLVLVVNIFVCLFLFKNIVPKDY
jgi:hypothetical protein